MEKMPAPINRETWLNQLAALMAPRFAELGYALPPFRVSVGFPSAGMRGKAIGECWDKSASSDQRFEVFIRPDKAESLEVAYVLAHELVHAAVGLRHGHKGPFETVALALGFTRPLTHASEPTDTLKAWLDPMLAQLGPIPHASLRWLAVDGTRVKRGDGGMAPDDGDDEPASSRPKKQTTRMKKCECAECGYTARVTQKWLVVGPPRCPEHGPMQVEGDAAEVADAA